MSIEFDESAFDDYAKRIIRIKKMSSARKLALEIYNEGAEWTGRNGFLGSHFGDYHSFGSLLKQTFGPQEH